MLKIIVQSLTCGSSTLSVRICELSFPRRER